MRRFGLVGYPLSHSFSIKFFNERFFPENGIDAEYVNFEIPDADMMLDIVRDNPELEGLNCTIPHKQAIIPLLDELSDEARETGAVNVIRIERDKPENTRNGRGFRLKGFNSDTIGFRDSIRPLLKPHHKKALVLGTGGAAKAVCHVLDKLGIEWKSVSRTAGRNSLTYSEVTEEIMADYTIIVNCTPLGMFPKTETCPELPYEALTTRHLMYDLIYNPAETEFMKRGAAMGAVVKNGYEMLELQAVASWNFWNLS